MEAYFASFENCKFSNCNLENSNWSFARITDTSFFNCNLDGADFPFAQGNFVCNNCMLKRATANNSNLKLELVNTNASSFEANCSNLELKADSCSLNRSEFNDGKISGVLRASDLTNAEFNRSKLDELHFMEGNAIHGIETEDSEGYEAFEIDLEDEFDED